MHNKKSFREHLFSGLLFLLIYSENMKTTNPLVEKSEQLALDIINLGKILMKDKKEYVLSKQIIRSGTSIGANIAEAQHAESRKDFASKLSISLKEARETRYWLSLLSRSEYIADVQAERFDKQAVEIMKILIASIKTAKQ